MQKAVDAVIAGELSLRRAGEMYGVPQATLHDRVSGKIKYDAAPVQPKYLTKKEEELLNFVYGSARIGYPRTRKQILCTVQQYMYKKGLDTRVGNGWWQRFRRRHQYLTITSAAPLSLPRG